MSKTLAEQSNGLSIFWLKKHGYLNKEWSLQSGGIKWTYGISESSIGFSVIKDNYGTAAERAYIQLRYANTSHWTGEKEDLDYRASLTTTPCHYGGIRYWFICPLTINGQYCGKRVGVLYSVGKYFGCRKCGNIAYSSQMSGGKFRSSSVTFHDIEELEQATKRHYYRGRPTRKYRRLLRMNQRLLADITRLIY